MKPRLIHGQADTRIHNIWMMMRRRCENPDCEDYSRYGGRGITVCPEWFEFEPFFRWATANGYDDNLTIDRRDNDGSYEPDNCRWVTRTVQNRNRRDNQRYDWRGCRMMLSEIAEISNFSPVLLRQRVRRDGLTIEDALSRPIRTRRV